jgi:hypothetical protein
LNKENDPQKSFAYVFSCTCPVNHQAFLVTLIAESYQLIDAKYWTFGCCPGIVESWCSQQGEFSEKALVHPQNLLKKH